MLLIVLSLALVGCAKSADADSVSTGLPAASEPDADTEDDILDDEPSEQPEQPAEPQEIKPTFTEDWPSHALPEGFPNLGKVTKVIDFRGYGNEIYIQWNIVTEDEVKKIVDPLNEYPDYDHEWQGNFYSDGLKYKPGTEEEILRVEIRYDASASGEVGENSSPQLVLEISGEALLEDKMLNRGPVRTDEQARD